MPSIFEYVDYREFLKDWYLLAKSKNSAYSYRSMADKIGINSGSLTRVLNGTRSISKSNITQFILGLKFNSVESEYFTLLVNFDNEKDSKKRTELYKEIIKNRNNRKIIIDVLKHEYFSHWYIIAIRELLNTHTICSIEEIQSKLNPSPSLKEVKSAIDTLKKLDLVIEENGCLSATNKVVTTGENWNSEIITNLQHQLIGLGQESLKRFHKEDRDLSTVTVSLSKDKLPELRLILKKAREEVFDLENSCNKFDRVYQLNLLFFPLTNKLGE